MTSRVVRPLAMSSIALGSGTPDGVVLHRIGLFGAAGLGQGWSLFEGVLFGLTDPSPEYDLPLWVTRALQAP